MPATGAASGVFPGFPIVRTFPQHRIRILSIGRHVHRSLGIPEGRIDWLRPFLEDRPFGHDKYRRTPRRAVVMRVTQPENDFWRRVWSAEIQLLSYLHIT